ncbi:hypothetical protein B0H17DRAFT_1330188 [Mycena rosella]|uniref:Uncharacterized protein n=1 Tax=Mycena rosella TaxID=1033263 RepID=A0AAD7DKZ5_MYCRO|nr:hypothetical protein B0H17DRAFT_1330188 [Mycena rosella]
MVFDGMTLPFVGRTALPLPTTFFTIRPYDTSAARFYRIYEFPVVHDNLRFATRSNTFATDPFLAALTQVLCASFNARIEMGLPRDAPAYIKDFDALRARPKILEKPPLWAEKAPPLKRRLRINAQEDDPELSSHLKDMGIIMKASHYLFT